jgi:hypothetical protein
VGAYIGAKPFPFLCFANPYLGNVADRLFSKRHIAATAEFNLINLIMLTEEALVRSVTSEGVAAAIGTEDAD